MRRPWLTVAVAQPRCTPLDVAANARAHAAAVQQAGARLVIFPELSLTGYETSAPLLDPDDPRLAPLVAACAAGDAVALAGAPVDGPHIAMLRFDASGVSVAYRKQHPHPGLESRFRPGAAPAVIDVDGWRVGLAICRDTGLPEHAAATAELGIDLFAAGLADAPADDVVQEERARRIAAAHRVPVAFASFAGPTGDPFPETAGRSGIWAADGSLIDRAGADPGGIARAALT